MTAKSALSKVRCRLYEHLRKARRLAEKATSPGSRGQFLAFASDYEHAIKIVNDVSKEARKRNTPSRRKS